MTLWLDLGGWKVLWHFCIHTSVVLSFFVSPPLYLLQPKQVCDPNSSEFQVKLSTSLGERISDKGGNRNEQNKLKNLDGSSRFRYHPLGSAAVRHRLRGRSTRRNVSAGVGALC